MTEHRGVWEITNERLAEQDKADGHQILADEHQTLADEGSQRVAELEAELEAAQDSQWEDDDESQEDITQ